MRSSIPDIRAILITVALSVTVGGCQLMSGGDVESVYQIAKQTFSGPPRITREDAASSPFASIGTRVGNGPQTMLILASNESGQQMWTSSAHVVISTEKGRIVRSVGFGHDVQIFQIRESEPAAEPSVSWLADYTDLGLFAVNITCRVHSVGREMIVVLGTKLETVHSEEICRTTNSKLDWSFTNTYWRDPQSGLAWRSLQHIHPRQDVVEIETLRPPL